MLLTVGIIMVLGLATNFFFEKIGLPGLLGMLVLGIVIGPYGIDLINHELLNFSADFRMFALIVILLRAGLGISRKELKKIGSPALRLSFIPGLLEGFTIALASVLLFGFSFVQGGMLGFILAAVSPAVVVPLMLKFSEQKRGTDKSIPTMIMAGASIDDVFAITIFSAFLASYTNAGINVFKVLLNIPISIFLGIVTGAVAGLILVKVFSKYHMRDTRKVIYILGLSILINGIESFLKSKVEIASLLGVMTIGYVILNRLPAAAVRLSQKFNKIWVFAEILLFVLVGAQVNISLAFNSGLKGLVIILAGLLARSLGVYFSVMGTNLNFKEKLFCILSYTPKATVQAAIGAIPLSAGVENGDLILAVAVLAIMITAPLGAIAIKTGGEKLLSYKQL
ncbi:MAG TPA: cation:proton antiporter [Petrotogaceae bacterium]|nr:cation:proton antiporter [Petrotogaceae bacterium]HOG33982.1 cation:proton antiporter [Petrotogaceae bacterium]